MFARPSTPFLGSNQNFHAGFPSIEATNKRKAATEALSNA
jgi:hypothetical protein